MSALLIAGGLAACSSPAPVDADGTAFVFSATGGPVANAEISVLEFPLYRATTASDGSFHFTELPGNTDLTFVLHGAGLADTLTGTFHSSGNLTQVIFQAPDTATYNLLATLTGVTPRPDRCQIATTVTRRGLMGPDMGGNGEPGATASIDPPLPGDAVGPIYFNTTSGALIYPDATLTQTSSDGGVLFLNVPPGNYVVHGQKDGTTFSSVRIKCLAGKLTNAAPPWGVSARTGGVGPRTDAGP